MGIVSELKQKLTEAMDTLQKNSETIEFLNKSLTEAQKFSFRALLSSKQNVASGSVAAAVATVQRQNSANLASTRKTAFNRLGTSTGLNSGMKQEQAFSQTNLVSDYKDNGEFSQSRSRSPYCEGGLRQSSNSPMRLMQKQ